MTPSSSDAVAVSGPIDIAQLLGLAAEGKLETVICAMPDLLGRLVGKRVTVETFLKTTAPESEGLHASLILFTYDMELEARDGFALTGWHDGFRDCRMVPDMSTLRLAPWLDRTAIVICDPVDEETGIEVDVSPRVILKRQLQRYRAAGMTLQCATELEFYLYADTYRDAWERRYRELTPVSYYRSDYQIFQSTKDEPFMSRLRRAMNDTGIEVEFSKSEYGLGQQELNLKYAAALEMADRHVIYKTAVKEMAAQDGLAACFMAKPRIDDIGSSCHVHLSVWDEAGTRSLMCDDDDDTRVSDLFQRFIAGQATHGRDLTLLFAPNVNSYKRFIPNQFAGMNLGWGQDNRTCGLRVVGEGPSMRLEHRIPGADANPYLVIAAIAAAGLAGIEDGLVCPPPLQGNAADHPQHSPIVALTLADSLSLFEQSPLPVRAFGEPVAAHLAHFFRQDLIAFSHEAITDWELMRYFERV
jgi:glutamine synthetase